MSYTYDETIKNLFIGNKLSADSHSEKFSLVVNCSKDIPFSNKCKEGIRIPVNDNGEDINALLNYMLNTNALEQIHNKITNNEPVLVHCFAGMQRSCAVVACYLIKYRNATPQQAIDFIKSKRRVAFFGQVNFMNALTQFHLLRLPLQSGYNGSK